MTMTQLLWVLAFVVVTVGQLFLWGLVATGSPRAALRYMGDWSKVMAWFMLAGGLIVGLFWLGAWLTI